MERLASSADARSVKATLSPIARECSTCVGGRLRGELIAHHPVKASQTSSIRILVLVSSNPRSAPDTKYLKLFLSLIRVLTHDVAFLGFSLRLYYRVVKAKWREY